MRASKPDSSNQSIVLWILLLREKPYHYPGGSCCSYPNKEAEKNYFRHLLPILPTSLRPW